MRRFWALILLAGVGFLPMGCTNNNPTAATQVTNVAYNNNYGFGGLSCVTGIAVSGNYVFVGDDCDDLIVVGDTNGNYITYFYTGSNCCSFNFWPEGMTTDNSGNLYVANPNDGEIEIYSVSAAVAASPGDTLFSNTSVSGDCSPWSVAVDGSGIMYVAENDYGCNEIYSMNTSGCCINGTDTGNPNVDGGSLWNTTGIALDKNGNIFAADAGDWGSDPYNNVVQMFDSNFNFVRSFGDPHGYSGSANGQLANPTDVKIDQNGNVLVADMYNGRISEFAPTGEFRKNYGDTNSPGRGGPDLRKILKAAGEKISTSSLSLNSPYYMAFDSANNLFVTDTDYDAVFKFTTH